MYFAIYYLSVLDEAEHFTTLCTHKNGMYPQVYMHFICNTHTEEACSIDPSCEGTSLFV